MTHASNSRRYRRSVDLLDGKTITVEVQTFRNLVPYAARRGITVTELVKRLLNRIVVDDSVTQILGDKKRSLRSDETL